MIIVNIAGNFRVKEAVANEIPGRVGGMIGKDTAGYMQNIIANAGSSKGAVLSSIPGIATLLFLFNIAGLLFSVAIITVLLAAVYKFLPDVKIR